jgi:hypothetical protein
MEILKLVCFARPALRKARAEAYFKTGIDKDEF